MPVILGQERQDDAAYLDACRNKRNTVEYDYVGAASEADAAELTSFVRQFRADVVDWLGKKHPGLLARYTA